MARNHSKRVHIGRQRPPIVHLTLPNGGGSLFNFYIFHFSTSVGPIWPPWFACYPTLVPGHQPCERTTNKIKRAKNGGPGGHTGNKRPRFVPLWPPNVWQGGGTHLHAARGSTGLKKTKNPVWFWAILGCFVQNSKTAADRRQQGVRGPNFACSMALHRVTLHHSARSLRAAVLEIRNSDPLVTHLLACLPKNRGHPLDPQPVM